MQQRDDVVARAREILARHGATTARAAVQRDATTVQEMNHVRVVAPPECGAAARIRTEQTATLDVGPVLQSLRLVPRDVAAAEIAAAAGVTASAATLARMARVMDTTMQGFTQQTVQGNQVIEDVRANVCDITLSNEFVLTMMVNGVAEAAVDVLLAAPEAAGVVHSSSSTAPPPPPVLPPPSPIVPGPGPATQPQPSPINNRVVAAAAVAALLLLVLLLLLLRPRRRG
jgi:hypothetical protein